jgi:ATP-dependent DNA helicase DinG
MPPPAGTLASAVEAAFAARGPLARSVAGYEPREGQRAMADAVAAVIENGGTLLAEAGTGTGKTLAYLVPAILSRSRVLVSTGTKNLQEQICFKDVPALRGALGVPFTATLMKGRSNYLCLHRWELYREAVDGGGAGQGHLIESGDRVLVPLIADWLAHTSTGDRAELIDLPEDVPLWKEVAAEAATCLGSECPRHADCFVTRMRQRAAESDVVVVNHHLLCADAAVRQGAYGEVIPACPTLVVDEAHQLEDVATHYFGRAISTFRVEELARDAQFAIGNARGAGPHGTLPPPGGGRLDAALELSITDALRRVAEASRSFFADVAAAHVPGGGAGEPRVRYTAATIAGHADRGLALDGALEALEVDLAAACRPRGTRPGHADGPSDASDESLAALARRASELRQDLAFLLRAEDPGFVYFLESRGRGLFLRAAPIDVSGVVREAVFDRFRTVVLTSATLAVDGSFAYVKGRLGIGDADGLRVPSEFDYPRQALLYLPRSMPTPRAPGFAEAAAREAIEILKRSRGRAFVLFTSYAVMRTVQRFVEMALPYPILVQGTAPRSTLLEAFRHTPHAVLLGTSSFWQGVDVVGEALSCVIIDKLPFASPGDPITAARIEALQAAGGDAFRDYQVPLAILQLQQGIGRLIRHRADRGVLAVLDPRLRTMSYGRRFLDSLPPAPVTQDLAAVAKFFE